MPRGHASPRDIDTPYISLDEPADLLIAGEDMLEHGYAYAITGHMQPPLPVDGVPAEPNAPGTAVRGIQFTRSVSLKSPSQSQISAELGQYLILDETRETIIDVLPAEVFAKRFSKRKPT